MELFIISQGYCLSTSGATPLLTRGGPSCVLCDVWPHAQMLYLLDASGTPGMRAHTHTHTHTPLVTTKNVSKLCQMSPARQSLLCSAG